MLNTHIPPRIRTALYHVRAHLPEVDRVVFWEDTSWAYITPDNDIPSFEGLPINVGILDDAVYDLNGLPASFQLEDNDPQVSVGDFQGEKFAEYSYTVKGEENIFHTLDQVDLELRREFQEILKVLGFRTHRLVKLPHPPWVADRLVPIERKDTEDSMFVSAQLRGISAAEGWRIEPADIPGYLVIRKDDEADVFNSDTGARLFVEKLSKAGSFYHAEALAAHLNYLNAKSASR